MNLPMQGQPLRITLRTLVSVAMVFMAFFVYLVPVAEARPSGQQSVSVTASASCGGVGGGNFQPAVFTLPTAQAVRITQSADNFYIATVAPGGGQGAVVYQVYDGQEQAGSTLNLPAGTYKLSAGCGGASHMQSASVTIQYQGTAQPQGPARTVTGKAIKCTPTGSEFFDVTFTLAAAQTIGINQSADNFTIAAVRGSLRGRVVYEKFDGKVMPQSTLDLPPGTYQLSVGCGGAARTHPASVELRYIGVPQPVGQIQQASASADCPIAHASRFPGSLFFLPQLQIVKIVQSTESFYIEDLAGKQWYEAYRGEVQSTSTLELPAGVYRLCAGCMLIGGPSTGSPMRDSVTIEYVGLPPSDIECGGGLPGTMQSHSHPYVTPLPTIGPGTPAPTPGHPPAIGPGTPAPITGPVAPPPPAGGGAGSRLFSIDNSGSMDDDDKIGTAKRSAHNALNALSASTEVALQFFGVSSCDVEIVQDFTLDHALIHSKIDTAVASGSTPLAEAIQQAGDYMRQHARNSSRDIILLTDGEESCEGDPVAAAQSLNNPATSMRRWPRLIPIVYAQEPPIRLHVVGFGITDPAVEQQLRQVADAGMGQYYPAGDEAELTNALTQAATVSLSRGDGNGDGQCTEVDALMALRMGVGLQAPEVATMDVNGDGTVTEVDALQILKWAVRGGTCG